MPFISPTTKLMEDKLTIHNLTMTFKKSESLNNVHELIRLDKHDHTTSSKLNDKLNEVWIRCVN